MFHVFLARPALATFGALAGIVLGLRGALLSLAFFGQLLLCLLYKTVWWLLWLPALLGVVGLVLCLLAGLPLSVGAILLFWGVYEVLALCGWAVSRLLRGLWRLVRGV